MQNITLSRPHFQELSVCRMYRQTLAQSRCLTWELASLLLTPWPNWSAADRLRRPLNLTLGFLQSPMPILTPKVPLAHALPVFSAMLYIAVALPRFSLSGCAANAYSSTKVLTAKVRSCLPRSEPIVGRARSVVRGLHCKYLFGGAVQAAFERLYSMRLDVIATRAWSSDRV